MAGTAASRAPRVLRRPARTVRRMVADAAIVRRAAEVHRAGLLPVTARALGLRRRGWAMSDAAVLGLLDPVEGPPRERWAVRRREVLALQEALNPAEAEHLTEDKAEFARVCDAAGIPTVPVAAVLARDGDGAAGWADALARLAPARFVVKPSDAGLASGVRVMERAGDGAVDHEGRSWSWGRLASALTAEPWAAFVVQERLHPHPEIARLSGSTALQCIRVVTLLDGEGRARVLYRALRIAVGPGTTDAFRAPEGRTSGNLLARVGDDGMLALPVGVAPTGYGLVRLERHPVTGHALAGLPVPWAAEADLLAMRAAEAVRPLRTVGWDVALLPDRPVVLEGNAWWGATGDPDGALVAVRDALRAAVEGPPAG